jgi:hypothetical protein
LLRGVAGEKRAFGTSLTICGTFNAFAEAATALLVV